MNHRLRLTCVLRGFPLLMLVCLLAVPVHADNFWPLIPAQNTNLALTGSASSSGGWGGGYFTSSINDGLRAYNSWDNGLALTYDPGLKWAAINFDQATKFNEVVLWQHGGNYTPSDPMLDYWDGSSWQPITFQRFVDPTGQACHLDGANSGYSDCDIYFFDPLTASAVRWSYIHPQQSSIVGDFYHGWVYEFEVYNNPVPEPATLLLVVTGIGSLLAWTKKRAAN